MGTKFDEVIYLGRAGGSFGTPVDRASAADPQNVWLPIFTVAGGLVRITDLVGVRTVIQAGGASNMQFRHSVGPTTICAAVAITGDAVGTIYTISGVFADNLVIGAVGVPIPGGMRGGAGDSHSGIIMGPGTIDVTMTAGAGTGETRYILRYIPIDSGATVVAA